MLEHLRSIKGEPGEMEIDETHPLWPGMVLCLPMNEGGGNILVDWSPIDHGISGMVGPPKWLKGSNGNYALSFSAATDEAFMTRKRFSNSGDAFTVFARMKQTSAATCTIFGMGERTDTNFMISFGLDSSGNPTVLSDNGDSVSSGATVTVGTWGNVAMSQTSGTSRYFMGNGKFSAVSSFNIGAGAMGATQPFVIGQNYTNAARTTNKQFIGLIECLYVWNYALKPFQLRMLNDAPYGMFFDYQSRGIVPAVGGGTVTTVGIGKSGTTRAHAA